MQNMMVKGSTTELLFLFLVCLIVSARQVSSEEHAKVLILGAGAAGLSAAKTLHDNGITDFIILEGSDRIGGRVKSIQFGGKTVEAGANWVAGKEGFPLWDVVQKNKIKGALMNYDSIIIMNEDGEELDGDEAWARLETVKKSFSRIVKELKEAQDMTQRVCLRVGGWNPSGAVENIVEFFEFDYDNGQSPEGSSCYSAYVQNDVEDEFYVIDDRGYSFILEKFAETAVKTGDPKLRLNEVVKKVVHTDSKVTVTTNTGKVFTSDYVVITFSAAVLQSGSVAFEPKLPNRVVDNLARVTLGNYVKIYLKFPQKFVGNSEFTLLASERRGFYPVWHNLDADGLFPDGTNIIRVVITGNEADRISRMTDSQIQTELMQVVKKMYKDNTIPDPDEIFVTRWQSDPLFMGTFCDMTPGGVHPQVRAALKAPVGKLYFAGEIYDDVYFCYVSGAIRSGEDTVKKILACDAGNCETYVPPDSPCKGTSTSASASLLLLLVSVSIKTVLLG